MVIAQRKATHARHYREAPQITEPNGTRHWITRAANFVTVFTEAAAGSVLERKAQPDEYMVLLPKGGALVQAGETRFEAVEPTLLIVPPGDSRIAVGAATQVARIFSNKATDLLAAAGNAATYKDGAAEVAPNVAWPDPVGGFKLRAYKLADYENADPGPLGMRLFRSTNLMVNVFRQWTKRREPTKLSPHWHDDFEQMSLCLKGSWVHHLRYPWAPDLTKWVEDEHEPYDTPSVLVIPAGVIHTSQDVGEGITWLVDIFGPPRLDFSSKSGLVLNAAEYPMPEAT